MLKQELQNQVEDLKIKLDTYKGLTNGLRDVVKEKDKKLSIANNKREEYYNLYCEEIKKLKNSESVRHFAVEGREKTLHKNEKLYNKNKILTYLSAIACLRCTVFIYLYITNG